MAVIAFPSWAYNQVAINQQPPMIVANQSALDALGTSWAVTPYPPTTSTAPFDPGLPVTDARAQQEIDRESHREHHDARGVLPGHDAVR